MTSNFKQWLVQYFTQKYGNYLTSGLFWIVFLSIKYSRFFYKQLFWKQHQTEIGKKLSKS